MKGQKMIEAFAQVEGEEFQRSIKCDLDESTGHPTAVLFWPSPLDTRRVWYQIQQADLSPSDTEGVAHIYTGSPLHIPKALFEIYLSSEPLSPDGFRLGFLLLPDSPGDSR